MTAHLSHESAEARARLATNVARVPFIISVISLIISITIAAFMVPSLSASTAAPVAKEVVDNDKAKQEAEKNGIQSQAIEDLAEKNADRKEKGLPPVTISKDAQDAVVNATLARVLDYLPPTPPVSSSDKRRIASDAAKIVKGQIVLPDPRDIIPCLSQPGGCKGDKGDPGTAGEQGIQGERGEPCDPSVHPECQGPSGVDAPIPVQMRLEMQDTTCFLITTWQRHDQSTFELKAAAASSACPTSPTDTPQEGPLGLPR